MGAAKTLLDPSDPNAPKFWMYETSGVLKPAVEALIYDDPLTPEHIAAIRAYIRQWVMSPVWSWDEGPELQNLRTRVDSLTSRPAINRWLRDALDIGMDPL